MKYTPAGGYIGAPGPDMDPCKGGCATGTSGGGAGVPDDSPFRFSIVHALSSGLLSLGSLS